MVGLLIKQRHGKFTPNYKTLTCDYYMERNRSGHRIIYVASDQLPINGLL